MSAFFNEDRIRVEAIGRTVTIPNNDIARLMYYLSCVDTVISYDELDLLSDYENYDLLNAEQKELLLKLVEILHREIFIKAGIFIIDENLIPDGFNNEFYQITDQRIGIHINQEIMIGGRYVTVLKIMACNVTWLNKYYYTPIKNIYNMKDFIYYFSKLVASSNNYSNNYNKSNYSNNSNYSSNSNYSNNNFYRNNNNYSNKYNYSNNQNNRNIYNKKIQKEDGCCCSIW